VHIAGHVREIPSSICYSRRCGAARTWAVCAHTYDAPLLHVHHIPIRIGCTMYTLPHLPSCTTHDARAPFAFACPVRKSSVHALLRARVCSVCVYRVPLHTNREMNEREREREIHFVSRYSCNLLVILLERTAEDSADTDRDHTRINNAARFIEQQTVARPICLELRYFHQVPSAWNRFPLASRQRQI